MKYCYKCQAVWEAVGQPTIRESCVKCSADLHVCRNCCFYDEQKSDECQVDNPDPIIDKEKANHCEEFQFRDRPIPDKLTDKKELARKQWNNLFRKK